MTIILNLWKLDYVTFNRITNSKFTDTSGSNNEASPRLGLDR